MSRNLVKLDYELMGLEQMPNQSRLANLNNQSTTRKWIMSTLQDFFIFTIKFKAPSTVRYADIKGNNTYKIDLTFRDANQKYLCDDPNQSKILEIWQHPFALFVDVKLLNNKQGRTKMGLGYLIFKGKCDIQDETAFFKPKVINQKKNIFDERKIKRSQVREIVLDPDNAMIAQQKMAKPNEMYFDESQQPYPEAQVHYDLQINPSTQLATQPIQPILRAATQQIVIDADQSQMHPEFREPSFPLTIEELQYEILQDQTPPKGYVTYPYQEGQQWWNILQLVRKEWVQGQKNIQNQKNIHDDDRMSSKIQVKHLFGKKVFCQGLDQQRRHIIQQTALYLGATILNQVQDGCLVVTTREYGEKIMNKKKFKNTKLVTEQYIFNCKRFNNLLNQKDYMIRK